MQKSESRMLTGPVVPSILRVALPSMTGMIASGLATVLDALLLGGAQLTAAVSLSFPLLTLIQTLGFTLGIGSGSFVSRCIGKGDADAAHRAASAAFFIALILSCALCSAGFLASRPLVALLGADESIAPSASLYARCVLAGGPLLCAELVLSSLLRGQGRTLPGMTAYLLSAVVSIPLELLLVGRIGILGAGAALLVRQAAALLVLLAVFRRDHTLIRPRLRAFSLSTAILRDIMRSGLPTLVRQGLMSLSSLLLTRASAAFGAAALGGMGLCVRICALISSAVIGFGQGFQPFCGINYGAGRLDRVKTAYRFCLRCVCISLFAVGIAVFVFARPLLTLFDPDPALAGFAAAALRVQSPLLAAQGAVIMMNMLTQALGLTLRATLIASSRQGFVFIPLLLLMPRLFGQTGLLLSQSVSDGISLVLCLFLSRRALTGSSSAHGGYSDARTASQSDRHS